MFTLSWGQHQVTGTDHVPDTQRYSSTYLYLLTVTALEESIVTSMTLGKNTDTQGSNPSVNKVN